MGAQSQVSRFFNSTLNRDFAEAERLLEELKKRLPNSEWSRGYHLALEGILLACKNKDDRHVLANRLNSNPQRVKGLESAFSEKAKNLVAGEFDKGFFSAWCEFLKYFYKHKGQAHRGQEVN